MRNLTMLDLEDALEIQQHILKLAANDGLKPVAICIVDATGTQLCAVKMDGATTPSIKTAHAKAVTAILFQHDTIEFCHTKPNGTWHPDPHGWDESDILAAMKVNPIFCHWAGGVLIRSPHDGSILGAVGVSNRSELEDHELAWRRPAGWAA